MTEPTQERLALEARAKELKLTFPANIGDAKLADRITAAEFEAELAKNAPPAGDAGKTKKPKKPKATGDTITVRGPKAGRWRAGRHFTKEPVEIALDDLKKGELAALKADPKLSVKE